MSKTETRGRLIDAQSQLAEQSALLDEAVEMLRVWLKLAAKFEKPDAGFVSDTRDFIKARAKGEDSSINKGEG